MKEIPVYLFIGFLESGKTKFVQDTLCDVRFNSNEKTLLLLCEEGIEEYDPSLFSGSDVTVEIIENQEDLNAAALSEMAKKCNAERVIIEYNGMWLLKDLMENVPKSWTVVQCMMFADAKTFESYNANMRTLTVDKLSCCELVVFNRMTDDIDKMALHKIVRGINRRADIAYEYSPTRVEYDDIEDPLPFDIDAPVIRIEDNDYAIFYRDILEEQAKYDGKTVKFKAVTAYDERMPKNIFAAGRHVMTCCVDDIEYHPFICVCSKEHSFKSRDWIYITGKIKVEKNKFYRGKGPVIYVEETALTSKPVQEVATFY